MGRKEVAKVGYLEGDEQVGQYLWKNKKDNFWSRNHKYGVGEGGAGEGIHFKKYLMIK